MSGQGEMEADRGHDLVDRDDRPAPALGPDGLPVLGGLRGRRRAPGRGGPGRARRRPRERRRAGSDGPWGAPI
ncbi:MAG: hypothetical protein M0C28_07330 [Candidatus Moduliflexus flocculans]|nr:hypothetical protein [Candidatus Moduliflexus flocculans]